MTDALRFRSRPIGFILLVFVVSCAALFSHAVPDAHDNDAQAQSPKTPKSAEETVSSQADDPLKRPRKAKPSPAEGKFYERWIKEDVSWIITPEEREAFKKLSTNAERDNFIETFWRLRAPNPDTEENEFKDEHYRRIAYANEHFGAGIPGWKTDRGHIYIVYGKPDSLDSHPGGGPYQRPAEEGGGQTETYPFEIWRYRNLPNVGQEVELEFVDPCGCGEYHLTLDRSEKDALKYVPNAGLTDGEDMGSFTKTQRFRGGLENLGPGPFNSDLQSKEFDRMDVYAKALTPPPVRFRDLAEIVSHNIRYNVLPFDLQVDFAKATSDMVLVPITIQIPNRELTYVGKEGVQRASLNIFGRLTTVSRRVAQTFEESLQLDEPAELFEKFVDGVSIYQKALPLRPGHYRLDVVLKDVNGDKLGSIGQSIEVPDFSNDDKLTASTLILADILERVPARDIGTGTFVIGENKVRPRVRPANGTPTSFKHDQKINLWMQVYNLALDEKTGKPSATVKYEVRDAASKQPMVDFMENTDQLGNVGGQLTLAKIVPPNKLAPGVYEVTITVNDQIAKQTIAPTARFRVE
ncbi:MAG TPA: GWxTD domain-containing protein [Candidatus Angelobacter sp.]|nr:GWxTD domain-containing protein [Candidatus Angelobacter sp.]